MKWILMFFTVTALLVTSGCVIVHRDRHEPAGGVDHGEHPGDLEHGDTMQK